MMIIASWVNGTDGHLAVVTDTSAKPVTLRAPEEVTDFVHNNIALLDDSLLIFLGQCFAVLCFQIHMRTVRDPVHMIDQMKRLIDAFQPYLNIPEKDQVFDCGVVRILDTIRSHIDSYFAMLLQIMVSSVSRKTKG